MSQAVYVALLALFAISTHAETSLQSLSEIESAVRSFVAAARPTGTAEIRVTVGRLDPRLRLVKCPNSLILENNSSTSMLGNSAVKVRCEGAAAWSIFVPVHIKERRVALVAARDLAPNHLLSEADLMPADVWIDNPRVQIAADATSLIGKLLPRGLAAGGTIPLQQLRSARTVRRGSTVTLAMSHGALAVRMSGLAMQDGGVGDVIQARNNHSKRVVEGVIQADGVILVR